MEFSSTKGREVVEGALPLGKDAGMGGWGGQNRHRWNKMAGVPDRGVPSRKAPAPPLSQ